MTKHTPDAKKSPDLAPAPDSLRTITCTGCPMGCQVTVTQEPGGEWHFSGAQCSRGDVHARQEITDPVRPLTTLIPVRSSRTPLSVKTSQPVPKALFWDFVDQIHRLRIECPIHTGDILAENLMGTGIALIATRNLE
jgi:CxxC motif-containing protein